MFAGVKPWEFIEFSKVPAEALVNKAFRDAWVNTPSTVFHVYTLFEGVQSNLRLRGKSGGDGDDNPPLLMHGLAVDYDTAMSPEQVMKALPSLGMFPPTWFEQTLSGNGRLLWMFEKPLRLPSRNFAVKLLEHFDKFLPFRKFAGIDEGCLKNPERYFTNGCRWTQISDKPVPSDALNGFVLKFAEKFDWQQKEFGKAVSLKEIEVELKRKYPRFALDWPGELQLGAAGPSFWIEGSTSPKSAIVRETGMHTFSAHATKAFYPWADLVGSEFVENNENIRLGRAVEGIYFDGRSFIMKDGSGRYAFHSKDNLGLLLHVHRGLKKQGPKGQPSEIDRAIAHVLQHSVVEGAGSCAFYPHGVFNHGGRRMLNTHQVEVLKPHPDAATWGTSFPFLSRFLDTFFLPVEPQKDRFLAWFKYHYEACLARRPVSGHGVFIAGPVGCGKTFLNRGVLGGSLGGFAEANSYLVASDGFNSELFDYALWCIDDGSVTSSEKVHQLFTENVKRTVANRDHRCNEKFRKAFQAPWQGRIVVTLNEDADSIRLIPNVDASILEKLMLFRAGERQVEFFSQSAMEGILKAELPHLLRWLVDWTPPAHCFEGANVRFGLAPYAEPSLLRATNLSGAKSGFIEILSKWLKAHFAEAGPGKKYWEGTATDLQMEMKVDLVYAEMLRQYRPDTFARTLVTAMNRGIFKMETLDDGDEYVRRFRIYREEPSKATAPTTLQSENSIYGKH